MTRTLIVNHQLLGDGLMTTPAIRAHRSKTDHLTMIVGTEPHNEIFVNHPYVDELLSMGGEPLDEMKRRYAHCRGRLTRVGDGEYACIFDASVAFDWCLHNPELVFERGIPVPRLRHLSRGFAEQLGVDPGDTHYDLGLTAEEHEDGRAYLQKYEKPVLLCAPLSRSCASRSKKPGEEHLPANVMLDARIWQGVLDLAGKDFDFVFLGASGQELLDIEGARWEIGLPIRKVAAMCKAARAVVTIDTGIGHMAQAVDANIVSICAALPRSLTAVDATRGSYYCVDYTSDGVKRRQGGWIEPIEQVTSEDILEGIFEVVKAR